MRTSMMPHAFRSSPRRSIGLAAVTAILLCGAPLRAHDMWIEPASFSAAPGQIMSLRLRVGQDLAGDPLPFDRALVNRFVVQDADGVRPVVGRDGSDPAGLVRVATPGLL